MKKLVYIIAVLALVACKPDVIEPEQVFITEEAADQMIQKGDTLYTLNEFVAKRMTKCGVMFPVRERSYTYSNKAYQIDTTDYTKNNRGWFSIDTIPTNGPRLYIRGRIITEDYDGNFYKSLVIQQVVNGKQQTLRLSVDESNAGGQYAIGQMIQICVNGLAIGKYANEPQLCVPTYNDNIYAGNASQKVGWAPGRIPAPLFNKATTLIGVPDKSAIVCDTLTLKQILSTTDDDESYHEMDGKLVYIKNVCFAQKSDSEIPGMYENQGTLAGCDNKDPETSSNSCVFAPTTNNVGYPQGRIITDATDSSLVSTSEYAKFAHIMIPTTDYKGDVIGILGHYTDNGRNEPDKWDWSITLRSRYDLMHFTNNEGEAWEMEEYVVAQ